MLLAALSILTQPLTAQPGLQPIRVWLEPTGVVAPGERMLVYVDVAHAGHLAALRVTTTGRIEVLFPQGPDEGTYVPAGTYELRATRDVASFVATEPEGTGLVFAALAPLPYRFDEFARAGAWDATAFAASWTGPDALGALLDVVQRMQGDGYFNYDFVRYTVVPGTGRTPLADGGLDPGSCSGYGCGLATVIVIAVPFVTHPFCDPVLGPCNHAPVFCSAGFGRLGHDCAEWCRAGFPCAAPARDRVVALERDRARRFDAPSGPRDTGRPESPRVIEPRPRAPATQPPGATPLARGKYVAPAPRRTVGWLAHHPARPAKGALVRVEPQPRDPTAGSAPPGHGVRHVPLSRGRAEARAAALPTRVGWPRGSAPARAATAVTPTAETKPRTTAASPRPATPTASPAPARAWSARASPRSAGSKPEARGKTTVRSSRRTK
jgi:hypothetical protein